MSANVDVFVCYVEADNKQWLTDVQNDLLNQPVNCRLIEVPKGNLTLSRTMGFSLGNAKYVSHVDSDDRIPEGVYKQMVELMETNPLIPMVCTGEAVVDIDLNHIEDNIDTNGLSLRRLHAEPSYTHSTRLYRREVIEAVIGDISPSLITTDIEIAVRVTQYAIEHGYALPVMLPIVGRLYRRRNNSASRTCNTRNDYLLRWKLFIEYYCKNPDFLDPEDVGKTPEQMFVRQFRYYLPKKF